MDTTTCKRQLETLNITPSLKSFGNSRVLAGIYKLIWIRWMRLERLERRHFCTCGNMRLLISAHSLFKTMKISYGSKDKGRKTHMKDLYSPKLRLSTPLNNNWKALRFSHLLKRTQRDSWLKSRYTKRMRTLLLSGSISPSLFLT
jgi:hypothetical protein